MTPVRFNYSDAFGPQQRDAISTIINRNFIPLLADHVP